ncbi:MAG: ABC transporter permease [Chloroflexota bacterium]
MSRIPWDQTRSETAAGKPGRDATRPTAGVGNTTAGGGSTTAGPTAGLRRLAGSAWRVSALPLALFFLAPVAALFTRISLAGVLENLRRPATLQAVGISLRTTLLSLAIILLLGTPLAYLMGRSRFRGKKLLDTLIDLPTVLPPSVAGLALLMTFGRRGPLGGLLDELGVQLAFTTAAVVLAQVFIAAPFYVRAAAVGFSAIDPEIIQAAQLDGAGRWQTLRYVIFPLARFALLSGAMMSWARALGEFGATMIFAGNFPGRTQTMPTAIYLGFERDLDSALTLSVILVAASFLALLAIKVLIAREGE